MFHLNSFPWAWSKALLRNLTTGVAQNPPERVLFCCFSGLWVRSFHRRMPLHCNQPRGFCGCIFLSPDRTITDFCTLLPHSTRGRVLQKAQSQEASWTFRSYRLHLSYLNKQQHHVQNISPLCFSLHAFSQHTHTPTEKHPLLQHQQVNWVCYLHWISFLKAAAERQAAGCCLIIQL